MENLHIMIAGADTPTATRRAAVNFQLAKN